MIMQPRRDAEAALKLLKRLLWRQRVKPEWVVTDGLGSYAAALQELDLLDRHRRGRLRENNRAENSHQPTRRRERQMKRFKSAGQAQRFLSAHDVISNLFLLRPHRVPAVEYRSAWTQAFQVWAEVTGVAAAV